MRPDSVPIQGDAPTGDSPRERESETGAANIDRDQPRLSVSAVARRLGVAPATLRTWDRRYGLGPGGHTSGRHRRYGAADLAKLERMQHALLRGASPAEAARFAHATSSAPVAPGSIRSESPDEPGMSAGTLPESGEAGRGGDEAAINPGGGGLRLAGASAGARGLGRAVLALDSWSAQRLMGESIECSGAVLTWREMVLPVRRAVAERHARLGAGVECVRLLADAAATALRSAIARAPEPDNPRPVVLACAPGEDQPLELVVLAAELAARGVGHRLFASALPGEGLAAAVRRLSPVAVLLWAQRSPYADVELIAGMANTRRRVRAFCAGEGWSANELPDAVEFLDSLEAAATRISGLTGAA